MLSVFTFELLQTTMWDPWLYYERRQGTEVFLSLSEELTHVPMINFVIQDVKPNPTTQPSQEVK